MIKKEEVEKTYLEFDMPVFACSQIHLNKYIFVYNKVLYKEKEILETDLLNVELKIFKPHPDII